MDIPIRKVTLAESARHAAQIAADTLEHQPNPHPVGSVEHAEWAAAYGRYFDAFMSPESEGSA